MRAIAAVAMAVVAGWFGIGVARAHVVTTPLQWYGLGTLECAAYSADGNYIATGGSAGAFLWDANTGAVLRRFVGHQDLVLSVAFSPDGTKIVTASKDTTAKMWNVADGRLLATLTGHTADVNGVAFSPDGTTVLTGSSDWTAKLWNVADGSLIRTFSGHTQRVNSVAFSFDGTRVLTGSSDLTAKLWNPSNGAETLTIATARNNLAVAFSPDGTMVLTGDLNGYAHLWNATDGSLIRTFSGHASWVLSVAFSPDGTQVLTGSCDFSARLWNASDATLIRTFSGHTNWVLSAAFSPDGTKVLTGSRDKRARLWNASDGSVIRTFTGHTEWVTSVAVSPDGMKVLTGSRDYTAKLWNAADGSLIRTLAGHTHWVQAVAFSPDGTMVVTGSQDGTAKLWNASNGTLVRTLATYYVSSVAFSPNGTKVLIATQDHVTLWNASDGTVVRDFYAGPPGKIASCFSPDGTKILTGGMDNLAKLYSAADGTLIRTFTGHGFPLNSVAYSPDGTMILTGSNDNTAKLWRVADATVVRTLSGHNGPVNSVAFSPDGSRILTGSGDKTARLWNTANGRRIHTFAGHSFAVTSAAFTPDGEKIVTASEDGTARLWVASASPKIRAATLGDLNQNGTGDAGEELVLQLDRSVVVTTSVLQASHFFLAVAGDSLGGAGFSVGVNSYNSRQIVLTLGTGAHLRVTGQFSTGTLTANSPSGIDFDTSLPLDAIVSLDGMPAEDGGEPGVDDSGIDVELSLVGQTATVDAGGGTVSVAVSPDAAYTRHELAIPAGALTAPTQITLRPPVENLGVINAMQIQPSVPWVTFAVPATVAIEYLEGDIDFERGQLACEMKVHQLVENPPGFFQYVRVPGTHSVEFAPRPYLSPTANSKPAVLNSSLIAHHSALSLVGGRVSVGLTTLNPLESLGTVGIFAGLPIETVDEQTINVRPGGGGGGEDDGPAPAQVGPVLAAGTDGAYRLHRIEFPGYVETTASDPLRLVVTMRTATLAERESQSDGQSFPAQSGAIFVVTATNASGQPVAFSAPVNMTVQFKERPAATQTDIVQLDSLSGLVRFMGLVRDAQLGETVDFRFVTGVTQQVNATQGKIVVENLTGLTGPDGQGAYGAVSREISLPALHWHLYR